MKFSQIQKNDIKPFSFIQFEDTQYHELSNRQTKYGYSSILFELIDNKITKSVLLRHTSSFLEDNPDFLKSWSTVYFIPCLDCEQDNTNPHKFKRFRELYESLKKAFN
jgi:hypothetical protein